MTDGSALRCARVSASYGDGAVLDALDLELAPGRVVAVLGVSGSGKTTLVSTIAGFHPVDDGTIAIAGRTVSGQGTHLPPEQRRVGVVFQHYALWPHLDAAETVAYPLRRRGIGRAAARARALELLDRLGLADLAHRRPAELSGGQQQRVGLARALAREPALFLFDEPTAHLDVPLRRSLQEEITEQRRTLGAAALYATHDAEEALAVADEVALLRDGRIVQQGSPTDVYHRPVDLAAARLTGPASVLSVELSGSDPGCVEVTIDGRRAELALPIATVGRRSIVVRPEWVQVPGPFPAVVTRRWYRGPHTDLALDTPAGALLARLPDAQAPGPGSHLTWGLTQLWPLAAPHPDGVAATV